MMCGNLLHWSCMVSIEGLARECYKLPHISRPINDISEDNTSSYTVATECAFHHSGAKQCFSRCLFVLHSMIWRYLSRTRSGSKTSLNHGAMEKRGGEGGQ